MSNVQFTSLDVVRRVDVGQPASQVLVMGIAHARFGRCGPCRNIARYDKTANWKQTLKAQT